MKHVWRLEPQQIFARFELCWACKARPAVWQITWFGCASPHCGRHPDHPMHPTAHAHFCEPCAKESGWAFDDEHVRRVRPHPWKLGEEVAA